MWYNIPKQKKIIHCIHLLPLTLNYIQIHRKIVATDTIYNKKPFINQISATDCDTKRKINHSVCMPSLWLCQWFSLLLFFSVFLSLVFVTFTCVLLFVWFRFAFDGVIRTPFFFFYFFRFFLIVDYYGSIGDRFALLCIVLQIFREGFKKCIIYEYLDILFPDFPHNTIH